MQKGRFFLLVIQDDKDVGENTPINFIFIIFRGGSCWSNWGDLAFLDFADGGKVFWKVSLRFCLDAKI